MVSSQYRKRKAERVEGEGGWVVGKKVRQKRRVVVWTLDGYRGGDPLAEER